MTIAMDPFATAHEMLEALRSRQISAVELLDLHLARIDRFNPRLNAIVTRCDDEARTTAAGADSARAGGNERTLLGLPLTVKDSLDVEGMTTVCGLPQRKGRVAVNDVVSVAPLREAGGVIIGKTNTPPYTGDWQTNNPVFGRTVNPWDPSRTSGGSTGGGAAAIAAGLTPLEIGSDIGGSIRIPAAFCGVYGHRPSQGLVPQSGHVPGSKLPNPGLVLNAIGPLSRDAGDLMLALEIMAGPDSGEDTAWSVSLPPARHATLVDYRVAIMPEISWQPVEDTILTAIQDLAAELRGHGATAEITQPEEFGDLRHHHRTYMEMLAAVFAFSIGEPEDHGRRRAEELSTMGDEFLAAYSRGLTGSGLRLLTLLDERERYREAYRRFFRDWDILLTPVTITIAFPHDDAPLLQRRIRVGGRPFDHFRLALYPGLAALAGQPATAFPAGLTPSGVPIGLQAIGPYLEDLTCIDFVSRVAEIHGGVMHPAGYA